MKALGRPLNAAGGSGHDQALGRRPSSLLQHVPVPRVRIARAAIQVNGRLFRCPKVTGWCSSLTSTVGGERAGHPRVSPTTTRLEPAESLPRLVPVDDEVEHGQP